jgi:transcriptional regulator with XRE-family HTH domain
MSRETFGKRLRRLRQATGLSQAHLALAAGVPVGTLRGWEYDRREPLVSAAAKLAKGLGVSLDVLAANNETAVPKKPSRKPK